jgi:hypothetical protein
LCLLRLLPLLFLSVLATEKLVNKNVYLYPAAKAVSAALLIFLGSVF